MSFSGLWASLSAFGNHLAELLLMFSQLPAAGAPTLSKDGLGPNQGKDSPAGREDIGGMSPLDKSLHVTKQEFLLQ